VKFNLNNSVHRTQDTDENLKTDELEESGWKKTISDNHQLMNSSNPYSTLKSLKHMTQPDYNNDVIGTDDPNMNIMEEE